LEPLNSPINPPRSEFWGFSKASALLAFSLAKTNNISGIVAPTLVETDIKISMVDCGHQGQAMLLPMVFNMGFLLSVIVYLVGDRVRHYQEHT